jgi:16S rRNA (adenine1518-N6/adenine1519-N6)-dimethyltransferase
MSPSPVVPKHALGQNFLVDPNILGVIDRLSALSSEDVVLEIGPGLGVLTAFLADRVRLVHAVEIDRSLAVHLRDVIAPRTNVALVFGDVLKVDLGALVPPPSKLVANLPYSVAAPIVIETLEEAPNIVSWCVMVQREVGERFFAAPRSAAYGAVSVLVQLNAERTGWHGVSRHVFRPMPRVDSALVAFRRMHQPERYGRVKEIVQAAFAHRRKTLANSVHLAGVVSRERATAAVTDLGFAADVRAEALSPGDFVRLAGALE